jgi:hypothetical protein
MKQCAELGRLLQALDVAEQLARATEITDEVRREREGRVRDLQRRVREHRDFHSACDYKPTIQ